MDVNHTNTVVDASPLATILNELSDNVNLGEFVKGGDAGWSELLRVGKVIKDIPVESSVNILIDVVSNTNLPSDLGILFALDNQLTLAHLDDANDIFIDADGDTDELTQAYQDTLKLISNYYSVEYPNWSRPIVETTTDPDTNEVKLSLNKANILTFVMKGVPTKFINTVGKFVKPANAEAVKEKWKFNEGDASSLFGVLKSEKIDSERLSSFAVSSALGGLLVWIVKPKMVDAYFLGSLIKNPRYVIRNVFHDDYVSSEQLLQAWLGSKSTKSVKKKFESRLRRPGLPILNKLRLLSKGK